MSLGAKDQCLLETHINSHRVRSVCLSSSHDLHENQYAQ